MQKYHKQMIPLAVLMLSFASHPTAGQVVITGPPGYQPPDYVLPVPPTVKIIRGVGPSGLDLVSDTFAGEYLMRWQIATNPPSQYHDTVGYINNGGHVLLRSSLTISGTTTGCWEYPSSDINCRVSPPYAGAGMLAVWSDVGPDSIGIVSRSNQFGPAVFGGLDRDGNVTTRIEESGTISLKPQVSDAETLPGYGRIFAKDLGSNVYGLFWRDPTGTVRRIDNCPQ